MFSLVQCTIILGVYDSYILANIIRPASRTKDVDQLLDKAERGNLRFIGRNNGIWLNDAIAKSGEKPFYQLRQTMERHTPLIVASMEEQFAKIGEGRLFLP